MAVSQKKSRSLATRNMRMGALCLAALSLSSPIGAFAQKSVATDTVFKQFQQPPQQARPRVWWHWMSGNVSSEGAALDLEWMQRIGIGGVHIFSGALLEPTVVQPPVPFLSEPWKKAFRESVQTARRAGMEVSIAGSPGWSQTGGIWVAPEDAMKKYVWSETDIEGGHPFVGRLNQPPSITGPYQGMQRKPSNHVAVELTHDVYRDAVVLAFPSQGAETTASRPVYTSNAKAFTEALFLKPGQGHPTSLVSADEDAPVVVHARYAKQATVAAVSVALGAPAEVEVQTLNEDGTFRTVLTIAANREEGAAPENTYALPSPISTREVRLVFHSVSPKPFSGMQKMAPRPKPKNILIDHVAVHTTPYIDRFEAKAGFSSAVDFSTSRTPENRGQGSTVLSASVVDLTAKLHPDGTLDWTPPPGTWTVVRLGYSLTGQTNAPAEVAATGLEVDKLDAGLVRAYLEHYLDLYRTASGAEFGDAGVQNVLTDSWEAGVQNWTASMPQQFKQRMGYDLLPFLPALTGRVVDSAEKSDRFLLDYRNCLKQMVAENHNGTIAQVLHEHHLGYYTEAQGDFPRALGDGLAMKSKADIPTAEFWYRAFSTDEGQPPLLADMDEAASAAHLYGRSFAAAESLTVGAMTDPWSFSPNMLKPVADEIFAHGINRILLHESHLQPFVDRKPGMALAIFGQYFNRNETWAEEARAWVDYLSRTSFLLQQGTTVADVAYFYGEDQSLAEQYLHTFNRDVPQGYSFDYVNHDALLGLFSVRNNRLVTRSGMSYRVLYLPARVTRLTLASARRMRDLVAAGAVLVAPRPTGGLGLQDTDAEIEKIAAEVWGDARATQPHTFGKGRVYATSDLKAALDAEKTAPDVALSGRTLDGKVMTSHRRTNDREIYFVSNQGKQPEHLHLRFRVAGMAPELWHADTGVREPVSFQAVHDGVDVPLDLAPYEATFVVFQKSAQRRLAVTHEEHSLVSLSPSWDVTFAPRLGAPKAATFPVLAPWNESSDAGIRYFSGHAAYSQQFTLPSDFSARGARVMLNLGEVREVASVSLNGSELMVAWHAPYQIDVTDSLHAGKNNLVITVVNLWPNRLIGDKQKGATTYTYAPQSPYTANSPLLRSGLLGPVTLTRKETHVVEAAR